MAWARQETGVPWLWPLRLGQVLLWARSVLWVWRLPLPWPWLLWVDLFFAAPSPVCEAPLRGSERPFICLPRGLLQTDGVLGAQGHHLHLLVTALGGTQHTLWTAPEPRPQRRAFPLFLLWEETRGRPKAGLGWRR